MKKKVTKSKTKISKVSKVKEQKAKKTIHSKKGKISKKKSILDTRLLVSVFCIMLVLSSTTFLLTYKEYGSLSIIGIKGAGLTTSKEKATSEGTFVEGIKISDGVASTGSVSSYTINVGSSQLMYAMISPLGASYTDVTWASSNPSILAVVPTKIAVTNTGAKATGSIKSQIAGLISGKKVGTVTLTATAKDGSKVKCSIKVNVIDTKVSKINITTTTDLNKNLSSYTIGKGSTQKLVARIYPLDATNPNVTWTVTNSSVLSLGGVGYTTGNGDITITGLKAGTVTLTAKAKDGSGVKGSITVTVIDTKVSKINITTTTDLNKNLSSYTIGKGSTQKLAVRIYPLDATNPNVTWTVTNSSVLSLGGVGYTTGNGDITITGLKAGTVTLTAKAKDGSGVKGSIKVTVIDTKVSKINITTPDDMNTYLTSYALTVGSTQKLAVRIYPLDATNPNVTWTVTNSSVLSLGGVGYTTGNGDITITGLKPGTVTLTATAKDGSGVKGSITVTVKSIKKMSKLYITTSTDINTNLTSYTLNIGNAQTLRAKINPLDATNPEVTWTTSNPSVLSVTSQISNSVTKSSGVDVAPNVAAIRGLKAGTSTLTATAKDGSGVKASIKVTVK